VLLMPEVHGMTVDGLSQLDLSYTPPLGSPWDAVQLAAQGWLRSPMDVEHRQAVAANRRCPDP
jgi:hypothetical protein